METQPFYKHFSSSDADYKATQFSCNDQQNSSDVESHPLLLFL